MEVVARKIYIGCEWRIVGNSYFRQAYHLKVNTQLLREPEDEDLCTDSAGSVVSGNKDCSECEKKRKIILNLQKKLWHVKRKLKEAQQQSADTPTVDDSNPPENPLESEQSIDHEMMDSHVQEEVSVEEDTDWAPCEENIVDSSEDQAETKNTISDRHRGIAKWIRETQPNTHHFHDLWHICKGIKKKLFKAGKEKGCEIILRWCKGIRSHLFWCALSTKQGFGDLIVAKWKSLMRHIADKHSDHPDQLYPKCAHDELERRDYIKIGLHVLGILHFNENVKRETCKSESGAVYYNVVYPKFKLGEEVVREIPVPPTYDYATAIKEELFEWSPEKIKDMMDSYAALQPKPLNTQFENRVSRAEAVTNFKNKTKQVTALYPEGAEQELLQRSATPPPTVSVNQRKKRVELSHIRLERLQDYKLFSIAPRGRHHPGLLKVTCKVATVNKGFGSGGSGIKAYQEDQETMQLFCAHLRD
eukprot:gene1881-2126_t